MRTVSALCVNAREHARHLRCRTLLLPKRADILFRPLMHDHALKQDVLSPSGPHHMPQDGDVILNARDPATVHCSAATKTSRHSHTACMALHKRVRLYANPTSDCLATLHHPLCDEALLIVVCCIAFISLSLLLLISLHRLLTRSSRPRLTQVTRRFHIDRSEEITGGLH
eukprot:jgi/Ulvmu1/7368/UM036_0028.1